MDSGSEIASIVSLCLGLFNTCLSEGPDDDVLATLEDEQRRFRAWSHSLKVFARPHVNLDAQLRPAANKQIREMVLLLLDVLRENLFLALNSLSSKETPASMTSDLKAPFFGIDGALKRLERLAAAILDATEASLHRRVHVYAEKNRDEGFERLVWQVILVRFPCVVPASDFRETLLSTSEVTESLEEAESLEDFRALLRSSSFSGLFRALFKSIVFRHYRMIYERERRLKDLNQTLPMNEPPRMAERVANPEHYQESGGAIQPPAVGLTPSLSELTRSETTLPNTIDGLRFKAKMENAEEHDTANTSGDFAYQVSESGDAMYPRPPRLPKDATEGICLLCGQRCPADTFEGEKWMIHVGQDIKPYVCLSQDCTQNPQYFARSRDWKQHMHKIHTPQWIRSMHNPLIWKCPVCSSTSATEFVSEEKLQQSLVEHMKQKHAELDEDDQWNLASVSGIPTPRPVDVCPICKDDHKPKARQRHAPQGNRSALEDETPMSTVTRESQESHKKKRARFAVSDGSQSGSDRDGIGRPARRTQVKHQPSDRLPQASDHDRIERYIGQHLKALAFFFSNRLVRDWDQESNAPQGSRTDSVLLDLELPSEQESDDNSPRLSVAVGRTNTVKELESCEADCKIVPDASDIVTEVLADIWNDIQRDRHERLRKEPDPSQDLRREYKNERLIQPVGVCLSQAPYIDPKLFIGRESEIAQMREILRPGDSSSEQRRLVLAGTGGMGKTQLAIAFATRHQQEYDSIFWLNAASEATLKDSFRLVAEAIFDVQDAQVLQDEQSVIQTRRWLSDKKNTRWLLIFDNYDDPDQYRIEQYYPYVSHGAIIVTTRRPDLVAGSQIRLQPLRSVEESLEILETRSRRRNIRFDYHARRLVERLNGLPLALATAGAYLRQSTFTCERYLQEYEHRWYHDTRRSLQLHEYQDRTLYTTWNLSYARLEVEDADAAKLLGLLAYFSNRRVWYELFRSGFSEDLPLWLHGIILSEVEFESSMRRLTNYCFLEMQTSVASWSMHTSVHDWTFSALNKVVDEKQYWYAFDCVGASVEQEDFNSLGYSHLADLTAHALRLGYVSGSRGEIMEGLTGDRLGKAWLIAELLTQQVQLLAADQMYMLALAGYEKELGPDHTSTLSTVNNLGNLYRDRGKLDEAEKMYQRALAGYEKALGADHPSTLNTVTDLGLLYAEQGKLDEAETMYQRALAGFEKALGGDHTSTLKTVNNLGLLYTDQGRLDEAEKMYQRALVGLEKALGADHPLTLRTVNNLSQLYANQAKLEKAEKMYLRTLAGFEKTLGGDHTSTLDTVNNLGALYYDQGKLDEAEQMYRRALAGFEKALGPDHTSTLLAVNNLGNLYRSRALAGYEKALGPDHPSTLNAVNNLGLLYADQGKLDEAEKMYRRALQGFQNALGANHTSTVTVMTNLQALQPQFGSDTRPKSTQSVAPSSRNVPKKWWKFGKRS
ncbi:uncharacterized protein Z518_03912 [Rhinocladiella mackenziei CBS 650.93]|uniref:Rhinocladiella mackenziei CBS 650.93 unplaced genomic scaffold supercont1.3, whole genome shotgun sequence n=1 Tax=Rhinocladiella mackenziei CBS 650.93 TaxID=1442369 RepID=A0A0D2H6C3_9EURO|nr:uncharacterized protein Z518_03912 [Rhinocladiella mackenziei CBS 650.93]KIX05938.1 hypothetical protein Z518_03912 [Rhinocladiella mackenziei CBS 650.93]